MGPTVANVLRGSLCEHLRMRKKEWAPLKPSFDLIRLSARNVLILRSPRKRASKDVGDKRS